MPSDAPIGIFDSGVGGISIMKEIRSLLPNEDIVYFADSAYCPYGTKPPELIRERASFICRFLIEKGAKIIVVACNTMSVSGLDYMRSVFDIPIVGVEPAVKPAAAATKSKKIGVLATGVTIAGERYASLLDRFGKGVEVFDQACPGLVELVEEGDLTFEKAEKSLRAYVDPLLEKGVDTIVLGCTHFPFLKDFIKRLAGPGIEVIDSGRPVALQTGRVLERHNLRSERGGKGKQIFYTSGDPEKVGKVISRLWNRFDGNDPIVKGLL